MNSTRISQAWLKVTENFSVSPTHSWLCGEVVKTRDWESVGWVFKYRIFFCFWKEKPSLISLILNTKSEKHEWFQRTPVVNLFWMSVSVSVSMIEPKTRNPYKKPMRVSRFNFVLRKFEVIYKQNVPCLWVWCINGVNWCKFTTQ